MAEAWAPGTGITDVELIECFVFHIPAPPPVSSISVNIVTVHPAAEARNLEVMLAFFFSLQFQMLPKCISDASVFLYFPKSKPLSPLTRTTMALTGLLTPTLFFFTLKKFFFKVLAALGCCTQTFYSCSEQGLFCSCSARALRYGGGSCHSTGPRARSHRSCGLWA